MTADTNRKNKVGDERKHKYSMCGRVVSVRTSTSRHVSKATERPNADQLRVCPRYYARRVRTPSHPDGPDSRVSHHTRTNTRLKTFEAFIGLSSLFAELLPYLQVTPD